METEENRIIFLRGEKIILRPLRKETDLEKSLKWVNDQNVTQFLGMYLPQSFQQEEEWFDNLKNRKNDIIVAIETHDKKFIGTTGLHNIDGKNRRATFGIIIGEKTYWGKGLGTEVLMLLLKYAFNTLNLHKVCSFLLALNERSLKMHLKCGFKEIGRRKEQFFRDGKYEDEILLEIFREDWARVAKKKEKR